MGKLGQILSFFGCAGCGISSASPRPRKLGQIFNFFGCAGCRAEHAQILDALTKVQATCNALIKQGEQLLMDEAAVKAALAKIDAATTQIATNLDAVATTTTVIEDDITTLQAALASALANGTGVTPELVAQAEAISGKASQASDVLSALVPVLQGIASKGALNPVPVEPPVLA